MNAVAGSGAAPRLSSRVSSARTDIGRLLGAHGLLIGCVGVFAGMVTVLLPREVGQDTWLALVAGRRIARTGLPHHDALTAWTASKTWVDQQWLAHLLSYGVYSLGGLVLLSVIQVVLLGGSIGAAAAVARRTGITARTIAWLLVATIYPILFAGGAIRTQSFAIPLFVAVLALLAADARNPSNRVFWTLPLLVLWANLHGSVVVAAGLVALRGLLGIVEGRRRARYGAVGLGAVLAVGMTPYGFGILDYYRYTLVNPAFRSFVTEWRPPTPGLVTAPIFVLMGAAVWLLARRTRELGRFVLLAELALVILSLGAVRSVVWLGLGSIVLLAPALDAELGRKELSVQRLNRMVAVIGIYFVVFALAVVAVRGTSALSRSFPAKAGDVVAEAAAARPNLLVLSNERFADWLLFEHPQLTGQVAYDARFELLSAAQLRRIFDWTNQVTTRWGASAVGSGVIVLEMSTERGIASSLRRDPHWREAYGDRHTAVFVTR